jgi:hypothetical protein
MTLLADLERLSAELKRNKWLRYFAIFCRIALALGFIPSGVVKVMGERFTALPSNHPLGHYFDALYLTGYYYTFIGVGQLIAALLLLIPRTALLGAIVYFRTAPRYLGDWLRRLDRWITYANSIVMDLNGPSFVDWHGAYPRSGGVGLSPQQERRRRQSNAAPGCCHPPAHETLRPYVR